MPDEPSAQDIIESYQKRQQRMPFLVGSLAIVLLIAGILILAIWLTGNGGPQLAFLFTATPTATETVTPSPVPPSPTATIPEPTGTPTETPTPSATPTASGPFIYVVEEGDTCFSIAEKFNVDLVVLLEINDLDATCPLFVGTELVIPPPGAELSTATPIPEGFFGRIEYRVQVGDTLDAIAIRFNSTVDAIIEINEDLDNPNEIFVGQILIIPVNIATPAPTIPPESGGTPGTIKTLTPTATP